MGTEEASSSGTAVSGRGQLFFASCFALVVSAVAFGIRADIANDLARHFDTTKEAVGWSGMGGAFWGFAVSIFIGGVLCDWLGMKRLILLACVLQIVGITSTALAPSLAVLAMATWLIGLGNGLVEAVVNPLVATVYPEEKTHKLNLLHVWWPAGIVIGGLLGYLLTQVEATWQIKQALVVIPAIIYGAMFLGMRLPATERVQSGVSTVEMFKALLRPLFIVFLFCMLLTAATELGPAQWMGVIMAEKAGSGILVLVWISLIMAIGRTFSGPVVHRLSPNGMLVASAALSTVGLLLMSAITTTTGAFLASAVFAVGICYFWPTMLGNTSERFPAGGALLLGLMGAAGMTSAGFAQPLIGNLLDKYSETVALRYTAILPAVLTVIFGIIYLSDLARGGYKVEKLAKAEVEAAPAAPEEAEPAETEKV